MIGVRFVAFTLTVVLGALCIVRIQYGVGRQMARLRQEPYDLVLTDLKLPGLSGLELIARLREAKLRLPIVLITAHGTTETAIQAIKLGAFEYLLKPFDAEELIDLVGKAVAHARRMFEPVDLGAVRSGRYAIIGKSPGMQDLYKQIGRVAATPVTVLIRGETGTGKELVARALYQHSDRADKPFIAVNCAAIQEREFREDLFYRLSVFTLRLPALSERAEDIPDRVRFFTHRHASELNFDSPGLEPEALDWLQRQSWPGNVRELENILRQALLLARPFAVGLAHVQKALGRARHPATTGAHTHAAYINELLSRVQRGEVGEAFPQMLADLEPELYGQAIRLAQGNQAKAARWLGVTRLKMREKLARFGLQPGRDDEEQSSLDPPSTDVA